MFREPFIDTGNTDIDLRFVKVIYTTVDVEVQKRFVRVIIDPLV